MTGLDLDELFGGGLYGVPAMDEPCEPLAVVIVREFTHTLDEPVRDGPFTRSGGSMRAVPPAQVNTGWRESAADELDRMFPGRFSWQTLPGVSVRVQARVDFVR